MAAVMRPPRLLLANEFLRSSECEDSTLSLTADEEGKYFNASTLLRLRRLIRGPQDEPQTDRKRTVMDYWKTDTFAQTQLFAGV